MHLELPIRPLTREAFAPFGDVIECAERPHHAINQGWAERYSDLAKLDLATENGRPGIGIVRSQPRSLPLRVKIMERHPLGSQAFIPLASQPFLIVVAPPGATPRPQEFMCFKTVSGQGINYARGTWHHPLIALNQVTDFLVVDRMGDGNNCDEVEILDEIWVGK